MEEFFISNQHLIKYEQWQDIINKLYSEKYIGEQIKESDIILSLRKLIEQSILNRTNKNEIFGIFFSGGLDSSLIAAICKKNKIKFTCYTVGFQDGNMKLPEDVKYAVKVAKHIGLSDKEFKYKIFNTKEIENILDKTAKILKYMPEGPNTNQIVNLGVAAVEVAAYSISKKEKYFFSGIGSEEIFAGYERHKNNPTNEECFNGLIKMYERDLLRDFEVSKSLGFSFLTPFLDKELVKYALKIPINYKINSKDNKIILRKAAYNYLKEYSKRRKKAAQYGSSFDKAITKLASKNGFKTKKEYYNSIIKKAL
ncbi:MAG: hypothetical protein KatS3mg002_0184 [Candidatus Woesearchaeota archaeon]|nr:MAG: hypothetical protein KatS3mg002_0184 [Candidatus Woesearchaeota archaeon]